MSNKQRDFLDYLTPFKPAVPAALDSSMAMQQKADAIAKQLTGQIHNMLGQPDTPFNRAVLANTAQNAQSAAQAQQVSQQAFLQQMEKNLVGKLSSKKDADWYARVRTGIDGLLNNDKIHSKELNELIKILGFVCTVEENELTSFHTVLRRGLARHELNFYDKELLLALKGYVNQHEADSVAFTIENMREENGTMKLDVYIKPTQPISQIEVKFNISPTTLDVVDEHGDITPAEVAKKVGERALAEVIRGIGTKVRSESWRMGAQMEAVTPEGYKAQFMSTPMEGANPLEAQWAKSKPRATKSKPSPTASFFDEMLAAPYQEK